VVGGELEPAIFAGARPDIHDGIAHEEEADVTFLDTREKLGVAIGVFDFGGDCIIGRAWGKRGFNGGGGGRGWFGRGKC
jgi:hypothetical protein